MTGNGTPTDLQGPLARMWRDVYAKAAGVAEGRTTELLKHHVYQYPHGAGGEGGGGGGGGLVELGRAVATAGQVTMRVPASGSLPTGYSGLTIVGTGLNNNATGGSNDKVYVFFNDDTSGGRYFYRYVSTTAGSTVVTDGSAADVALHVGYAPSLDPAHPEAVYGLSGTVPLHEGTALPKAGQFLSSGLLTAATPLPWPNYTSGIYAPNPAAPITSVHLRCILDGWRAGSTLVVYGHGPATGGDGGGGETGGPYVDEAGDTMTGTLVITAPNPALDARGDIWMAGNMYYASAYSIRVGSTGAYATTGALRLMSTGTIGWRNTAASGDHTLGVNSSDQLVFDGVPIMGGGGGTGNTTMYTQTGTPTGAANSLWFNPSETA